MGKLTAGWCERFAGSARGAHTVMLTDEGGQRLDEALRIAAATLRWCAKTETGGDDHAERQAMIAACKEATT